MNKSKTIVKKYHSWYISLFEIKKAAAMHTFDSLAEVALSFMKLNFSAKEANQVADTAKHHEPM